MDPCQCGCGREIIRKWFHKYNNIRYIQHHQNRNKKHTEETKRKMSLASKGKKKSPEHIKKSSETLKRLYAEGKIQIWNKGKPHTEETKQKIREKRKLLVITEESNIKRSETMKKKINPEHFKKLSKLLKEKFKGKGNPFYGKKHSKEFRQRKSISSKNLWKTKEYREKVIKNTLKALYNRPTSFEKRLKEILDKLQPNEWKYTGDGSFLIGYKNPDFINCNGKKLCIEVYHDYFKIRDFGTCENYENQRSKYFSKYGWDTIFIDENHLNEESIKNILLNV